MSALPQTLDFGFLAGGAPAAVLGLGKSGMATAVALKNSGVDVAAWDDQPAGRDAAKAQGIDLIDLNMADLAGMQFLAMSPGIPLHFPTPHPVAVRAQRAGCPIIGDIELL